MPPRIELRSETLESPVVQQLFGQLNAELDLLYPEDGANHFRLSASEVAAGRGAIFVAYSGSEALGCGAIRALDGDVAELKRLYVVPRARGCRLATTIMTALETEARKLGVRRLVIETGERQPHALALAQRFGFGRVPAFGEYVNSPLSVCLAKEIR